MGINIGNNNTERITIDGQQVIEVTLDGSVVFKAPIGTEYNPASSGYEIAQKRPDASSGYYWIKSPSMPNKLQMYVDMSTEGGGYDFYAIQGGSEAWKVSTGPGSVAPQEASEHDGTPLGLDLIYPRSKQHWEAMTNFVSNVLNESGSGFDRYFRTAYAIYRDNSTDSGSGDGNDYTNQIMRDPNYYGSGASDWKVPDGGRWWLRDTTFGEPNGDYLNYQMLGIYSIRVNTSDGSVDNVNENYEISENYSGEDLEFNDIGDDKDHTTGGYYLVSTNAKP